MSSKKGLKMDAFITSVRPDPNSSEQLQLLQGYLGKSSLNGHVRLYFDEALNNYVEVPEADILHALPYDKSENPLGGCRLWVKKSTIVTFGDPKAANRPKSSFLEGDLMSAYGNLGINPQGYTPNPTLPTGPITTNAPTTIITAPISLRTNCKSLISPCPTKVGVPCRKSIFNPPCFFTILTRQQTICVPTCFKTCFQFTCYHPICNYEPTIIEHGFPQTIGPSPVINPGLGQATQATQFTGAFNPYNY